MSDHPLSLWFVLTMPKASGKSERLRPSPRVIAGLYRYGRRKILLSLLALVAGIYAVVHGHTEVLVWLAWGFLPRFLMRMGKPRTDFLKGYEWDDKLAKRSQGNDYWFPGQFIREGIGVNYLFWLRWKFFASYEVVKTEAEFFVIRLWRDPEGNAEISSLATDDREESLLRLFARNVPMLVTLMSLVVGFHEFGWRADVLVALFLSLQFFMEARMRRRLRRWAQNAKFSEDLLYLDVAFDSSKVSLEDVTERLNGHLPRKRDWV